MTFHVRRAAVWAMVAAMGSLAGCADIERPTASFAWCPDGREGRLEYAFTSTPAPATGHDIIGAVWEFGDGSEPREGTGPIWHVFPALGSYAVTLTVTDRRGVRGTITQFVSVEPAAFVDPTWRLTLGFPPMVTGVVGNAAGVILREVVVRVRFYDPDGLRVGDERRSILNIEPHERVRFEIAASEFASRVYYASVEVESFVAACDPVVAGMVFDG